MNHEYNRRLERKKKDDVALVMLNGAKHSVSLEDSGLQMGEREAGGPARIED